MIRSAKFCPSVSSEACGSSNRRTRGCVIITRAMPSLFFMPAEYVLTRSRDARRSPTISRIVAISMSVGDFAPKPAKNRRFSIPVMSSYRYES